MVVAGILYLWQGWAWLDPVVSLIIAGVIVFGTWSLFRQSVHLLFDGVPESVDLAELDHWLLNLDGVVAVHDLHVWAMSTYDNAMTVHLVMPAGHPGDDFYQEVAKGLHDRFGISHPTLQIETTDIEHGCARPLGLSKL